MSGPEGQKLVEPNVSPFHHLIQQIYKQSEIDINWLRLKKMARFLAMCQ